MSNNLLNILRMCSVVSIKITVRREMFWCYCSDWCSVKGHTLLKKTLQLSDTGLSMNYNTISIHSYHHCVKSVQNTELFLVRIFLYSDWIRRFTPSISVFSPNKGKHGPEITPYLDNFRDVYSSMMI